MSQYLHTKIKDDDDDDKKEDKDKLIIIKASINLENVDIESIKPVIGFINGEEVKQDIPISLFDNLMII